jgi:hypothetical protein
MLGAGTWLGWEYGGVEGLKGEFVFIRFLCRG